jgi:hypothetical protein
MHLYFSGTIIAVLSFQTPNGNVEARVACFYRRRDISSYLVNQVDRLKLEGKDNREKIEAVLESGLRRSLGR